MDSQGYVFLSVLAKFNRIKQLTQETELIRYVCLNSSNIEFWLGPDGIDRLRKREGWQQWVLNKEERDPSAQNDGLPYEHQPRSNSQIFEIPINPEDGQGPAPHVTSVNQRPDDISYQLPVEATPVPAPHATTINGAFPDGPFAQTPLSATVPEFAPAAPPLPIHGPSQTEAQPAGASSFTDEQVESLMIVVRKPVNAAASTPPLFSSSTHRTFSNGSIDSRTIYDDLAKPEERRSPSTINGETAPEG